MLSIWFFIGISLLVNGVLITGVGLWELIYQPEYQVVLFNLRANLWWGTLLSAIGLFYCIRFRPKKKLRGEK